MDEKQVERDKRRWKVADEDKDGLLSLKEFRAFVQPDSFQHMDSIVVEETFEDMDANGDGTVTEDEFIKDMNNEGHGIFHSPSTSFNFLGFASTFHTHSFSKNVEPIRHIVTCALCPQRPI